MKAKRALALLLSVALAAAVPVGALADDNSDGAGAASTTEEAADPCAEGHDYEETVEDPTCTEDGIITYTCRVCGDSYTEKGDKATGHDYEKTVEDPTCTEDGTITYTCRVCGDSYTEKGDKATGHDYGDGKVTKKATEDAEGEMTYTCKNCGSSYTEPIPKLEKKEKEKDDSSSGKTKQPSSDKSKNQDGSSKSGKKDGKDSSTTGSSGEKGSGNVIEEQGATEETATTAGNAEEAAELLPLWFAGRQVTKADCKNITGDKSISYDEDSRTLTLNKANCAFNFKDSDDTPAALIIYNCKDKGKTDLTVKIKDDCILSASAEEDLRSVIRVEYGSLYIEGTGSLYIKGTDEEAALYAKEDIVLFEDAKDNDHAGTLNVEAKTIGLLAGEKISVKAGTLSVEAVDKDKDEDDDDWNGIALLAEKNLTISKDLEIASPASGKTYTDKKKKQATIVENGENTPAAKVLIQEPEETEDSESKDEKVKDNKKNDDEKEALKSDSENEDDSAGKKNDAAQETLKSDPENENDSLGKKNDDESIPTNTDLEPAAPSISLYLLTVNGIQVTDENKGNIDGSGKISYDDTTNTLTLNGYNGEYDPEAAQSSLEAFISYTGTNNLNIEINGRCSISAYQAESANRYLSVIRAENASLILKGSGSLTIESKEEDAAIYSGKNILLFKDDNTPGTLEVDSKTAAIKARGSIIMSTKLKIAEQLNATIRECSDGSTSIIEEDESDPAKYVLILPTNAAAYTVTFKSGGAKGSMDPVKVSPGPSGKAKYKLPECGFDQPFCAAVTKRDSEGNPVKDSEGNDEKVLKHGWAFTRWTVNNVKYNAGKTVTIEKDTTIKANWISSKTCVEKQAKVEPTCTNTGVKEHYKCSVCEKLFSAKNQDGSTEITKEVTEASLVIPATGHSYGDPTYEWTTDNSKVTANHVCTVCKHPESETVATTKTGKDATCEEDGKWTYTATFSKAGFTTKPKVITKKAIGHNWSPTWTWNTNFTKASLELVCQNNSSHTRTASDVKATGLITKPTSPTSNGKVVRTVKTTLEGTEYTDIKELVIKPAGNTGYKFVSSTGTANPTYSWTVNSSTTPPLFIVKRNEYDQITFAAFEKITVDNHEVSKDNYTVAEGSLKLSLKSTYLNKLSKSSHTLKVFFTDGTAQTKFTVKGSSTTRRSSTNTSRTSTNSRAATRTSTSTNPRTGDTANWITWLVLAAGSAAVLAIILFVKKRSEKKD